MRRSVLERSLAPCVFLGLAACAAQRATDESVDEARQASSVAGNSQIAADVGSGYAPSTQSFLLTCVTGSKVTQGQAIGDIQFDRTVDKSTVASSLGFDVGLKARFGLFDGDASASLTQSTVEDAYSESFVFYGNYVAGKTVIDTTQAVTLTPLGQQARANGTWNQTCGDEFVGEVQKGAKFYFVLRVDFDSTDAKQSFDEASTTSIGALGAVDVKQKLDLGMTKVGSHANVHVQAFQLGGDPTKLATIFGATASADGGAPVTLSDCSGSNIAPCKTFLDNAVSYAASPATVAGSLQSQLGDPTKWAPIGYTTYPWIQLAIPSTPAILTQQINDARAALSARFEQIAAYRMRIERIQGDGFGMPASLASKLAATHDALVAAQSTVNAAVQACYDGLVFDKTTGEVTAASVNGCQIAVGAVATPSIDPSLLDGAAQFEIDDKANATPILGVPAAGFTVPPPSAARDCAMKPTPHGDGDYCDLTNGAVYWTASGGAHELDGTIATRYEQPTGNLPAASDGPLGFPLTDVGKTPDVLARYAGFQSGEIYVTPSNQTLELYGPVWTHLAALTGGVRGGAGTTGLGYPTSEPTPTSNGVGQYVTFQNGMMLHSPGTGAHWMASLERDYWLSHQSQLGFATADESSAGGQAYTQFQNAVLMPTSSGMHSIRNEAFAKWSPIAAALGAPVADSWLDPSVNCWNTQFEGGWDYYFVSWGRNVVVQSALWQPWYRTWPTRWNIGYPQADESMWCAGGNTACVRQQRFDNGVSVAGPAGAFAVHGALWYNWQIKTNPAWTSCGFPTSDMMSGSTFYGVAPGTPLVRWVIRGSYSYPTFPYFDPYGSTVDDWYVQRYEHGWIAATLDQQHAMVRCSN